MSQTSDPILSFTNKVVLTGTLFLSFIAGGAIVVFGLSAVGLSQYTTGNTGAVTTFAGGLAGMVCLFAYLSYQYYRTYEK
ncbi:hypothetical protein Natpe_0075 [Natrinema pellirubrum DSM 15624]|uniref:Uncharacterized protein n=1 Tax=Natrinema pellirubrum (strain DSM 15624 / CIP 106293 / JCM 10476 / NCIMB 786 / 157) TaxID=797303 RepID=L0JI58_NATP1|nr:hypothetical protein [Natrinema pellirubrum]AGB30021.1 hypothetical protein Natpe_0075 [Natrinema pellirubrum DSM 15624]